MKLILANNQGSKFVDFYNDLKKRSDEPFDYAGYKDLLFLFDTAAKPAITVKHFGTGKLLNDYDGVYINGYLSTYELAATMAVCCDYLNIAYANHELKDPPSLSKLSMHAKLAAGGVASPRSYGGAKQAIVKGSEFCELKFPAVLKRADADRGIDNFKVGDWSEIKEILEPYDARSLWILQEFVPNEGFYLVSFYDSKPVFSIYRTLEERPDGDSRKAHFYKPLGGANASLVPIDKLPQAVLKVCQAAVEALNRQIASVDCLYDPQTDKAHVLEVNYNPQLVTISTFKDFRQQAFLDNLKDIK